MLKNQKILLTGASGQIALPLGQFLATDNEVWAVARFSEPGSRARCEQAGMVTRSIDLASGDFGDLPQDFDYVLHLAVFQLAGQDYDHALQVNAEGTALLMAHCRGAKACLVMSTCAVYALNPDPRHAFREEDPLGDSRQPYSPTYAISKIAQEAVARSCARLYALPTTIARMNVSYSSNGGLPAYHLDTIMRGEEIVLPPGGEAWYTCIHQDDINRQVEALLTAASVPATIVNWSGDEPVDVRSWCQYLGELAGRKPVFREDDSPSIPSRVTDNRRRLELVGPCRVSWREGFAAMARERYPGL
ncbi:MAG: NAD(P)-dependent oxidoreductase [Haliea sp.]|uniref:NAD-dependent epimerase/dehydratase family protein n=1 Tax=Haliea sp. TaxID=1932666 RepID=UPI0032EBB453